MRIQAVTSIVQCAGLATSTPTISQVSPYHTNAISDYNPRHTTWSHTSPSNTKLSSAPAPTVSVSGCISYYVVKPGQTCAEVAQNFGLDVDQFMSWNPSVDPPSCSSMWAGYGYCVATNTTTPATPSVKWNGTTQTSACSRLPIATPSSGSSATMRCGRNQYRLYLGNGSAAAGWPTMSEWVNFDCMFEANAPVMQTSCPQWGVAHDSTAEIADMKDAVKAISANTGIDSRFILAVIMQESSGCVRVPTTYGGVRNPGLMQSHDGNGTCNSDGVVQTPCAYHEIRQMIYDGTAGTSTGDGLVQCMQKQGRADISRWYRTARMYNGGSIPNPQNLDEGCCTASYASDIANRLTGWTTAPRNFPS